MSVPLVIPNQVWKYTYFNPVTANTLTLYSILVVIWYIFLC